MKKNHIECATENNEEFRHRFAKNQEADEDLNSNSPTRSEENYNDKTTLNGHRTKISHKTNDSLEAIKSGWISCDYCNLPSWLQHNDCLLSGHRPPLPSVRACFQSIFRIHTETVNIWSHMLGCVAFTVLAIYSSTKSQETLLFLPFFIGAILCLGFSFIFHILHCHSPQVMAVFSRLDYCGIALLIMGSFTSWIHYCFYCHFWLKMFYTVASTTLGVSAVTVSLLKKFGRASYRPYRAAIFSCFGLSGVIPALHFLMIVGWDQTVFNPMIIIAVLYILGAALYATRIPEILLPGKCDIWFHSHQVFHILVVIATLFNYKGIVSAYNRTVTIKCK